MSGGKFNIGRKPFIFPAPNRSTGGGGGITALPVGNFVFVNPLGSDATGVREDESKPFATLSGALAVALAGDTIFVRGGQYNEAGALHKTGVKWHFEGKPILNLFAGNVWSDSGAQEDIQITGDAVINHQAFGGVIVVTNANTTVNANFHKVTGLGTEVISLRNGSGVIRVETDIICAFINRAVAFGGNATYYVEADQVINNAFAGSFNNAVHIPNQAPLYSGYSVLVARYIVNGVNNSSATVGGAYANMPGTVEIHVLDSIDRLNPQNGNQFGANATVSSLGGFFKIFGDINGRFGIAIDLLSNQPKGIEHHGNAYNDGSRELVYHGNTVGFWSNANTNLKLNGGYSSSNDRTIQISGAGNITSLKGAVYNTSLTVGSIAGLFIQTAYATDSILIEGVKFIVNDNGSGSELSIESQAGSKNIKITFPSGGTLPINATNLIPGNAFLVDSDYE